MSKNALLTLNVGGCLHDNSRQSFQAAARRWNCDYVETTNADVEPVHAMKLKCFDICDADRIFYIDADAVISAGCPSPFEAFPEDAFIAIYNNQDQMDPSCRNACADNIARDLRMIMNWRALGETGCYPKHFVNSGVWLASRKYHRELLALALKASQALHEKTAWKDQSALNYALLHLRTPLLAAPPTWNYQFPPDTGTGVMEQFIYHWAGGEKRDQIDGVNWQSFRASSVQSMNYKPKLLLIADHCVPTGFARVAENICTHLAKNWDLYVIGINYTGIPHDFPYPIWPAKLYGDIWGIDTCAQILPMINPDAILVIQDPWIVARYVNELDRKDIPFAAYMPVDAKNQHPAICGALNKLDLAIFYTKFGEVEVRIAGYKGPSKIIPHGIDTEIYRPIPRDECRERLRAFNGNSKEEKGIPLDAFVVGNVNRNQPRKRLDLTIQYFAEWIKRVAGDPRQRINDVYLYLHCAQQDTMGWDLMELAYYYGITHRLIMPDKDAVTPRDGFPEVDLPYVYGCFDVQVSTSAGEGWSLPTLEGMACGIAQIVPQYAALGEWAPRSAYMVPVSDERVTHSTINTIGAIPEKQAFINALDRFYKNPELREKYSTRALRLARKPEFRWENIAVQFDRYLKEMIAAARGQNEKRKIEKGNNGEIQKEIGIQESAAAC